MRTRSRSLLVVAAVLALAIVANVVAYANNAQADLSSGNRFQLRAGTRALARAVESPMRITAFMNPDGPNGRDARFLLARYRELNRRITTRVVDPDEHPSEARRFGISRYSTVILQYEGRRAETSEVTEQELSTAILRLLRGENVTVCYVVGHGEGEIDDQSPDGMSRFADMLRRNAYELQALDLAREAAVPDRCRALILAGPRVALQTREVEAILAHLRKAGRMLYLASPLSETDPNPLLEPWTMRFLGGLVVDPLRSRELDFSNLVVEDFPTANPVVDDVPRVQLPVAGALDIIGSRDGLTVARLAATSDDSFVERNPDTEIERSEGDLAGPIVVAMAADDSRVEGVADPRAPGVSERIQRTRIVVTGSAEWVRNRFLDELGNRRFALNAMNWLAQEEQLLTVGAEVRTDRPLPFTAERQTRVIAVTMGVVPAAIVGFALVPRLALRRRRR